jgi:hypothetical protein
MCFIWSTFLLGASTCSKLTVTASGSRVGNDSDDIYGSAFQELIYNGDGS